MRPRERVLRTLSNSLTDRLPTQITFTPLAAKQASLWLDTPVDELPYILGNHILDVLISPTGETIGTTSFDLWGTGWDNTINDGFQVNLYPLAESTNLANYRFPDPDNDLFYNDTIKLIEKNDGFLAVFADIGFTLWERYYLLRGLERAMEDLAVNPSLVNDLLDRILEIQIALARNLVKLGIDVGYTGDDFGSQRGLLFSPETWRRFFKPRYEKLWGVFTSAGIPVCHHSCGDIRPIIGEMIDIGLSLLCPVQPQAMPADELAMNWGERLAFWGGICTQSVLPFGTPSEVIAHVRQCQETLGRYGRYIVGPSHDLTSDVPRENFFAMLNGMGIEVFPRS